MNKYSILLIATLLFGLNQNQIRIIHKCYSFGSKYGLGNTLAGICLVESQGGKYLMNQVTEDYGITGINIKTALRFLGEQDNYWNRVKVASKLVRDDKLALTIAVKELLLWKQKKVYWYNYVSAYNRGTVGSYKYAGKVSKAIKYLKRKHIIP